MFKLIINNAVNHPAYRRGLTSQGNTACRKRAFERILPEILFTMDRMTNPFKPMVGSEVPFMLSTCNYVVLRLPRCIKQPVTSRGLVGGSPKVKFRRSSLELGISRNMEILGKRRTRSTVFICRKGSSLATSFEPKLEGFENNEELKKLRYNLETYNFSDNFSKIMSNPEFLMACWVNVRARKGSMTPAFGDTLDGLDKNWFIKTSEGMRNGLFKFSPARRAYVPKPNGKLRPLTMPSPRDKIVQEGMRFLLQIAFEPTFSTHSYGYRPGLGCHSALKSIKRTCKAISWYIEGDIEQQFPTLDHRILVDLLRVKIKDQAFIDLIYKYLRTGYGETHQTISPMHIGVIQGGTISPILSNIYMSPFDEWMEELISDFNKGENRKLNPEYFRSYRTKSKDKTIRSRLPNDVSFKRMYYFRYVDDFIIGIDGSKEDCLKIRKKIYDFLKEKLNLSLNLDKTKITHAEQDSAKFLGYVIHKTKLNKMKISRNKNNILMRRVPRPILDAPISKVVIKLEQKGYAKNGLPTRNSKFVNHQLADIVEHYKTVERGIFNYYSLASNYGRFTARIHYILKYSCVLTIASKMKLTTMRRVFRKYGKNLSIRRENGSFITYPAPSYAKPHKSLTIEYYRENFIDDLTSRLNRGRRDLNGVCTICGVTENIEIHHVKALRKNNVLIKKDFLSKMMSSMNRKQIPLCRVCHQKVHSGKYDGPKLV